MVSGQFKTIAWVIVLLFSAEIALQVRSHLRFGQSVLNVLTNQETYFRDAQTGLKLLRPNAVIEGAQATIRINGLGLRSPQIASEKPAKTTRIAIVGASTVMGAYSKTNEMTMAYQLEAIAQAARPEQSIEVINAGIAGFTLRDQARLIETILKDLDVDIILLYTGFNDITGYCRTDGPEAGPQNAGLARVDLPKWLMSQDLLIKNTVFLRETKVGKSTDVDPAMIDTISYENDMDHLIRMAKSIAEAVYIATNARSFRRDMPEDLQANLSETARFYNDCFDTGGLHEVYDRHNAIIASQAAKHSIDLIPLDRLVPGGRDYFTDATHFSQKGERLAAELFYKAIASEL